MIVFLRVVFLGLLVGMIGVTSWAGLQNPLFTVPVPVATHPWFVVALVEAYAGFLTFFVWVCYKQTSWLARAIWLVAIVLLGHIAIAAYCLSELFHTPRTALPSTLLTVRRDGTGLLGPALAVIGLVVVLLGFPGR